VSSLIIFTKAKFWQSRRLFPIVTESSAFRKHERLKLLIGNDYTDLGSEAINVSGWIGGYSAIRLCVV
jgi:hypothetical protein